MVSIATTRKIDSQTAQQSTNTAKMPDSTQNQEARRESPSNTKDDVPATSSPKASPAHEESTESSKIQVVSLNLLENPLPIPTPEMLRPTKTVDCNMMQYTDGDGVTRQIYMPKGTAKLASDLFMAKRYSDLAKFPVWGELSSRSDLRRRLLCSDACLPILCW